MQPQRQQQQFQQHQQQKHQRGGYSNRGYQGGSGRMRPPQNVRKKIFLEMFKINFIKFRIIVVEFQINKAIYK